MNVNVVLDDFTDLKDNNHIYKKDSLFPFENKVVEEDRIEELSSSKNKRNKKLIKQVKISKLNEKQLLEYAMILGIDIRKVILDAILATDNADPTNINSEQTAECFDDKSDENVSDKNTDSKENHEKKANENVPDKNSDNKEDHEEKVNE